MDQFQVVDTEKEREKIYPFISLKKENEISPVLFFSFVLAPVFFLAYLVSFSFFPSILVPVVLSPFFLLFSSFPRH